MKFILYLSDYMIPLVILYIVGYAVLQRCPVYDLFVTGAKEGMKTVAGILPTLVGLMMAVGILRSSGAMDYVAEALSPVLSRTGLPAAVVPLIIVKMFSSSAASSLLLDLFKTFGPDSLEGILGSILLSCTETIFYTMSVYFMAAKVTKTRYTLAGALMTTVVGIVASVIITGLLF